HHDAERHQNQANEEQNRPIIAQRAPASPGETTRHADGSSGPAGPRRTATDQFSCRGRSGTSSEKAGIATSKTSPRLLVISYEPTMMPDGVESGAPLVYSNDCPGSRTGCSPTTP